MNPTVKTECVQCSDEAESSFGFEVHCISPRPHTPNTATSLENLKQTSCQQGLWSKGRVKGACKRQFLGDDTSSEEDGPAEKFESWTFTNCLEVENWEHVPAACTNVAHVEVKIESDIEQEPENSWGRPLTSEDLSSESSDLDTERTSLSSYVRHTPRVKTKKRSDMVLKLRKVYYTKDRGDRVSHYQRVPDQSEGQRGRHSRCHRKKKGSCVESCMQHSASEVSSRSQHCPYLSTQCTSEHRQRWVLRSAVQKSHRYPELVGKRIRHLYEENDKTEVWYKGVVLRVHEAHSDPLKTVFEVKYDSEPEWQYYLELLVDYKKGWLQIED